MSDRYSVGLAAEIRRVDGSHTLGAAALADALAPWLAAHDAKVKAEALREAAADVRASDWWADADNHASKVRGWLRGRANKIVDSDARLGRPMSDLYDFHMRAVEKDSTGYYHVRWDRATKLTVRATNRNEAYQKCWAVMGEAKRHDTWTAKIDRIEAVTCGCTKPGDQESGVDRSGEHQGAVLGTRCDVDLLRTQLSGWLTEVLSTERPGGPYDGDLLDLRDWIDDGAVGDPPVPGDPESGVDHE